MTTDSVKNNHAITVITTLLLLLGTHFLFSDGLSLEASRSVKALWDLGHVVYFILLTFILLKIPFFQNRSFFNRCLIIIVLAFIIGVVIEALQYGTARNTDMYDVAHDILGSLIVLVFYQPKKVIKKTKRIIAFNIFVSLFCVISLWPLTSSLWDEVHAHSQFPILIDFSSALEVNRCSGSAEYSYVPKIENVLGALKIVFKSTQFSGVSLEYFESNWDQYAFLNIVIFNGNKNSVERTLKIHDLKHQSNGYLYNDRFNHRLIINRGWNEFKIALNAIRNSPKTRMMNLKQVNNISIFSTKLSKPETLYLKSIYLSQ